MKKFRVPVLLALAVALATTSSAVAQSIDEDSGRLQASQYFSHRRQQNPSLHCSNHR